MSDVAKGAARVRAVEAIFWSLGYRTAIVSRSGQRRGARASSLALDGDLIAIAPADSRWPHFVVEVGGLKKSAAETFREMAAQGPLPPGFVPLCVRLVSSRPAKRRWHSPEAVADDLPGLLAALA